MRLLLAIYNAYTDNTSGAAISMRTIVEWLASAGFECRVVCTARFDAMPPSDIATHIASLGVPIESIHATKRMGRANATLGEIKQFTFKGVPVSMLLTKHHIQPDKAETDQFAALARYTLKNWRPDVVLTYGSHPGVGNVLRQCRSRGIRTVFSVRNYGYEDPRWYTDVDQVLTCSSYLSNYYKQASDLNSTGIPSPIDWSEVLSGEESRTFVTFVHPSRHKGAAIFARLADMLGSRRPDIPVLVVQSAADATELNSIPGIDFSKYPQIMAAPAVSHPSDFFELTKILVVPSVFREPFGRVAAEALINGVPPIVSDRGALPETVQQAGYVVRLPEWLEPSTSTIPTEMDTMPWFESVCRLWDDQREYTRLSVLGRATAGKLYSEDILKPRYLEYFGTNNSKALFGN